VRYDHEAGKGDHRHIDGKKERYLFIDVEALVRDFLGEVERRRST
jgi:hypothetical protein